MHATAAAAARQLPGVCTFALEATKQRENANWSRIGQLTRSGQVGYGFAKVRVILGHFLAVSENSEPRGAGPAASEAVWTAERTNAFNRLYLPDRFTTACGEVPAAHRVSIGLDASYGNQSNHDPVAAYATARARDRWVLATARV